MDDRVLCVSRGLISRLRGLRYAHVEVLLVLQVKTVSLYRECALPFPPKIILY